MLHEYRGLKKFQWSLVNDWLIAFDEPESEELRTIKICHFTSRAKRTRMIRNDSVHMCMMENINIRFKNTTPRRIFDGRKIKRLGLNYFLRMINQVRGSTRQKCY